MQTPFLTAWWRLFGITAVTIHNLFYIAETTLPVDALGRGDKASQHTCLHRYLERLHGQEVLLTEGNILARIERYSTRSWQLVIEGYATWTA